MTPAKAAQKLAELYLSYSPLLDALRDATADNVAEIVFEEQRQAEEIWTLGPVAFGKVKGSLLKILKPKDRELLDIADFMTGQRRWLSEPHRVALIGCCVRSLRLRECLDGFEEKNKPDKMKRVRQEYDKRTGTDDEEDTPELRRQIAEKFGVPTNTVRKVIREGKK